MLRAAFIPFFYAAQPRPKKGKYYSFGGFNNCEYAQPALNLMVDPASRGSVHIKSADPFDLPDLDVGLLTHPADLPMHVWMYKV